MADDFILNYDINFMQINNTSYNIDFVEKIFDSGDFYINGNAYEKNTDTNYGNITYIILENNSNKIIKTINSIDGTFSFKNLSNENYNIIAIDNSNIYNGKYIQNIQSNIDYQDNLKIIQIYKSNSECVFRITYSGNHTLTLIGTGTLTQISPYYYKITNFDKEITLSLVDYVDSNAYMLEKTYIEGDNSMILKEKITEGGGGVIFTS